LSCIGCDHEWRGQPDVDMNIDEGPLILAAAYINVNYTCPKCELDNVIYFNVDFDFSRRMTMEQNAERFMDIPVKQETIEWRIVRNDRLALEYEADGDVYAERKEASE